MNFYCVFCLIAITGDEPCLCPKCERMVTIKGIEAERVKQLLGADSFCPACTALGQQRGACAKCGYENLLVGNEVLEFKVRKAMQDYGSRKTYSIL